MRTNSRGKSERAQTRGTSNRLLPEPLQQIERTRVLWRGRQLIYFGGCDYFRLSSHPEVVSALKKGVDQFGLNVAASRFTTGNHELYEQLEKELAAFFKVETATLVPNGYAANLVLAQALTGDFSHALIDSHAHQSLRDALEFLKCPALTYAHGNVDALSAVLRKLRSRSKIILLSDGLFSHDGSLAPVPQIVSLLSRGSAVVVDDAHGAGTIGRAGGGTLEVLGMNPATIIRTMSLSKAFGTYGGVILGDANIRRKALTKSPILRGNTPLPLPLANAALQALRVIRGDESMRERLVTNTQFVRDLLQAFGYMSRSAVTPLITIHPPNRAAAVRLRRRLLKENIFPSEVLYGGVKPYFRFAISSEHSASQLMALVRSLRSKV